MYFFEDATDCSVCGLSLRTVRAALYPRHMGQYRRKCADEEQWRRGLTIRILKVVLCPKESTKFSCKGAEAQTLKL